MTTYQIGIFAIFGGFMLGLLLFDEPGLVAAWREPVGGFVTVFTWCAVIVGGASLGKWLGAYVAARSSGFDHAQAAMLGFMMNTRALMELIVIDVGFDLGVISQKMFTMLVIMAIASTVITTRALRYYLARTRRRALASQV